MCIRDSSKTVIEIALLLSGFRPGLEVELARLAPTGCHGSAQFGARTAEATWGDARDTGSLTVWAHPSTQLVGRIGVFQLLVRHRLFERCLKYFGQV